MMTPSITRKPMLLLLPIMLAACGTSTQPSPAEVQAPAVGMANPASVHCEQQGGKLLIEKDADGNERGICELKDGTRVDEWELYRRDQGDAVPSDSAH